MSLRVTVARIGRVVDDGEGGWTGLDPDEWNLPYEAREKSVIDVHEDETLGSVLDRAAARFEIPAPEWGDLSSQFGFVAFYRPEHEVQFSGPISTAVTLVDEEGRALWNRRFKTVRYADLIRAGDAGALQGDPSRPYLVVHPEIGNGVIPDWVTVANLFDLAWYVMERFAVAYTTYKGGRATLERLVDRTKRGRDAIESRSDDWTARWGDPATVARFLGEAPRRISDVARFLDCSEGEAEGVLWALGFSLDEESRLWVPGGSNEARLMGGNFQLILGGFSQFRLEARFRERLEIFLETGEAPSIRWGYEEDAADDG